MASSQLEGLSLNVEGEEEGFCFDIEEEGEELGDLRWCLVGRFLGDRPIHVKSMKVRIADLWRSVKGVTIKQAKEGLFLFQFAHALDMEAALKGGPWTFDNHLLIMERVQLGVQIENIPLFHVDFWVQVHNLPAGLMLEKVGRKLANYIGAFVEYDKNNNTSFWRQYMRLRVRVDVRQPLKKDTKVKSIGGEWCTVNFKYEKLGMFCFICGIMGHSENKCEVRYAMENDNGVRGWSRELRAETKRQGGRPVSRWLREESGGGGSSSGGEANQSRAAHVHHNMGSSSTNDTGAPQAINPVGVENNSPAISLAHQNNTLHQVPITNYHIDSPILTFQNNNMTQTTTFNTNQFTSSLSHNSQTQPAISITPNQFMSPTSQRDNYIIHPKPNYTCPNMHGPPLSIPIHVEKSHLNQQTVNTKKTPDPIHFVSDPNPTCPKPTHTVPTLTQTEPEDMEVQSEKKRRREEESKADNDKNVTVQYFLSAGPGSQDCRDK
jgi:14-3-3 protein epsilon